MRHAKPLAFCCALALAGIANAQSLDSQVPTMTPDPYAQSIYGGAVAQRPSTRSLFVGTIATLLAQALGSGIGAAVSQGLGGSITKWFNGEPGASVMGASPQPVATPMKSDRETPTALHAGLAYEVHLIGRDGAARAVDPARHVFHTGDRFQVYYRPTLPGRVERVQHQSARQRIAHRQRRHCGRPTRGARAVSVRRCERTRDAEAGARALQLSSADSSDARDRQSRRAFRCSGPGGSDH